MQYQDSYIYISDHVCMNTKQEIFEAHMLQEEIQKLKLEKKQVTSTCLSWIILTFYCYRILQLKHRISMKQEHLRNDTLRAQKVLLISLIPLGSRHSYERIAQISMSC